MAKQVLDEKGAIEMITHMLDHTLRLMGVTPDGDECAGSGLLWRRGERYFTLTAGHTLKGRRMAIETTLIHPDTKVLMIGLPNPIDFKGLESPLDFGWSEIKPRELFLAAKADPDVDATNLELRCYTGEFIEPSGEFGYIFAAWKAHAFVPGPRWLDRDPRYELWMEFEGRDHRNGYYRFKLARKHQGHDYYEGCSGAPIADNHGRIVALLVGSPDPAEGILWGIPLIDVIGRIG
jgi:hypothetical protein